jgi:hypothetical protein
MRYTIFLLPRSFAALLDGLASLPWGAPLPPLGKPTTWH